MNSNFVFSFLIILAAICSCAPAYAVPVDTATAGQHQTEIELIQELSDAVSQLDGEIASQQNMLAGAATDRERNLINAQIKTLRKHQNMLKGFVGEFTGELMVKGVPVQELLDEQRRERRERYDEELERQIVNRRETELADKL